MKTRYLLTFLFLSLLTCMSAQDYNFIQLQNTYTNLINPISLTNGLTWDEPEIPVPIGFDFELFDKTISTLYVRGGGVLVDNIAVGGYALISIMDLDLADRSFDPDGEEGMPGGISPISYQLSGMPGNRIFKLECNNAGLYDELEGNGTNEDFLNFQLWLYEGSNMIELHYGPNSLTNFLQILSDDEEDFELSIVFDAYVSDEFGASPDALALGGDPTNPEFGKWSQLNSEFIDAPIPSGTVYRFSKVTTSSNNVLKHSDQISCFPNPAKNIIQMKTTLLDEKVESISILNLTGQLVQVTPYQKQIDISHLDVGTYFIQIKMDDQIVTNKLMKMN